MKVEEFDTVKQWIKGVSTAKNTKDAYLQGLRAFVEFTKMSPGELLTEAETEEMDSSIRPRNRKIKAYLQDFKVDMQERGLSDHTVKNRMTGVRRFYQWGDITVPDLQGERTKALTIKANDATPTRADLQDVLKVCDPLEKALLLTGASSGLASNEIRHLTVEDFKKGFDPITNITTLEVRRLKVGYDFITFLSPEATKAVSEYLEFRNREAKAATARRKRQLEKQQVIKDASGKDSGYLFILRQIPDKFLKTKDDELRQLSDNAVQKLYRSISDKAQKNSKSGTYNIIRSHTMRKYFFNALTYAHCEGLIVEFMMGHSLDGNRSAYFRANVEELKKTYAEFVTFLTIQSEKPITETDEFKIISAELQRLRVENEKLKLESYNNEALKQLKGEVEEFRKAYEDKLQAEENFASGIYYNGFDLDAKLQEVKKAEEKMERIFIKTRTLSDDL